MTVQPREACTAGRIPGENEMTLPGQDLSREPIPADGQLAVTDGLAARVRVLRRARRDAETRASRVRRVLLAPTVQATAGEAYVRAPHQRRH